MNDDKICRCIIIKNGEPNFIDLDLKKNSVITDIFGTGIRNITTYGYEDLQYGYNDSNCQDYRIYYQEQCIEGLPIAHIKHSDEYIYGTLLIMGVGARDLTGGDLGYIYQFKTLNEDGLIKFK